MITRDKKEASLSGISTGCNRCGTCCMKGGPTLHKEDRKLFIAGHIGYQHLITLRKGEPAYTPITEKIEPVKEEIVRIAGKDKTWECLFYNKKNASCSIYLQRPLECRLLECRDTSKLISVIGKNTIARADLIASKDPILKIIKEHEKECPVRKVNDLISKLSKAKDKSKILGKLTFLIQKDMELRGQAVSEFGLSLQTELFYFGRPLFKLLIAAGIPINEINGEIQLNV
ncbi:MAG: YkgJ family cysteine cluster protein [Nitrospirae bacterium]|nr:YkgJ family cysteine cluster protein [Nitrospirota bacterium]